MGKVALVNGCACRTRPDDAIVYFGVRHDETFSNDPKPMKMNGLRMRIASVHCTTVALS